MGVRFNPPIVADTPLRFDTKLKCTVTEVRYDAGESPGVVHVGNGELGANEEIVV